MTSIRAARKRQTRSLILDAARELFERQGYAATTVDHIAQRAGTTRATLYLHFTSKSDVLVQLVQAVDEHFASADGARLPDVVGSGDAGAIRDWLNRTLDGWTDIRPSLAMITESDADAYIAAVVYRWHGEVIASMCAALDTAKRFEPATREIRCTLAFGALEFLSRRFIRAGGWSGLDRRVALDTLSAHWSELLSGPTT